MLIFMFGMGNAYAADVRLSATGGNGKIDLSWTVNGNLRGVQVMRDTDANPSGRQRLAILAGKVRNYTDNSVANGRQYWYWIKYTDTNRATGNSNAANATAGSNDGSQPIAVTGVTVTPASASLSVGSTSSLTASVQPANASNKGVSWSSSNTGVATVNASGLVAGVSAGNATITAITADGGRTASSSIRVLAAPKPTPIPMPTPIGGNPPEKTVRVFWVHPSDVPADTVHPEGIAKVMKEAQRYYKQELGKTFRLNDPVVEVVAGQHPRSYYENTPQWGEKYWYSVANMQIELLDRFKLGNPDNRWLLVGEISAEGDGAGGGANIGWVMLCQHDADGSIGIGGDMNRWYGGMVHELGHAFGLPDSTYTDGTPMSASFYSYPNTHFTEAQKNAILNGPFGSFLF